MTEYPKVMRLFAMLAARPGVALEQLKAALQQRRAALQQRFGDEAQLDIGVRRLHDPFAAIGGERKVETADAILQLSYHERALIGDILPRLGGLAAELADSIDITRSSLSIGLSLQIVDLKADIFFGFVGRRRPDLIPAQMSVWWLEKHAPLSLKLVGPMHGYAQMHFDIEASRTVAEAAGFPHVPYDMGDSIEIPDLEKFVRVLSDPELSRIFYEDEQQFLDTTSWRIAFTDKI